MEIRAYQCHIRTFHHYQYGDRGHPAVYTDACGNKDPYHHPHVHDHNHAYDHFDPHRNADIHYNTNENCHTDDHIDANHHADPDDHADSHHYTNTHYHADPDDHADSDHYSDGNEHADDHAHANDHGNSYADFNINDHPYPNDHINTDDHEDGDANSNPDRIGYTYSTFELPVIHPGCAGDLRSNLGTEDHQQQQHRVFSFKDRGLLAGYVCINQDHLASSKYNDHPLERHQLFADLYHVVFIWSAL